MIGWFKIPISRLSVTYGFPDGRISHTSGRCICMHDDGDALLTLMRNVLQGYCLNGAIRLQSIATVTFNRKED